MRGIVNIVVGNGLFLKLITATYTIHIENDLATFNIQLFAVKWLPVHTALQNCCKTYTLETFPYVAALIIMIK